MKASSNGGNVLSDFAFILKLVPAIFYSISIFSPNVSPIEIVFLFHRKSSSFSRNSKFCNSFPSFPHFLDSKGQM